MMTPTETNIPTNIFRAYDIRGIVETHLTPEVVYSIGLAIGSEALAQQQTKIIVGRDGRLSGPTLSKALIKGLLATGCDVVDIGMVPTPVVYFATNILDTRSGIMVTGSHNPADYNGLKIVLNGKTLSETSIRALYDRVLNQDFVSGHGHYTQTEVTTQYLERIAQDIQVKRRLKIVVDCANGIPGALVPQLFEKLNCDVIPLYCDVDGRFPNHHPDPTQLENMQDLIAAVKKHGADVGLGFDGDGDRLGVVTNEGELIWPDRQMMLYAEDILARNPGSAIVFDVKCSSHLAAHVTKHGGQPIMWKTGHSLVKNKMRETGALLAGEMSGHIFFKERWYGFDDALYTGARLLEILSQRDGSCHEVFQTIPNSVNTPELKITVSDEAKFELMEKLIQQTHFKGANIINVDGLRVEFKHGWGLVRASNTTPCLVVRFEAQDDASLETVQAVFREQLLAVDNSLELPF